MQEWQNVWPQVVANGSRSVSLQIGHVSSSRMTDVSAHSLSDDCWIIAMLPGCACWCGSGGKSWKLVNCALRSAFTGTGVSRK